MKDEDEVAINGAWPDPPRWLEAEELREALRFGLAPAVGHQLFTDARANHRRYYKPAGHIFLDEAKQRFAPDFLRCQECGAEEFFEPPDRPSLVDQMVRFIVAHRHGIAK